MLRWFLHRLKGDKIIWILIFVLSALSLLAIYSATSALSFRMQGGDTEHYLFTHLLHLVLGIGVIFVVHLINYRVFAQISNILLAITIPLLVYTVLQGSEVNEAARWISIFGQSFQPSDLAQLTLIIYLAKLLTQRQDVIRDFTEGFLPALFWVSVICGLIAPQNLSTAALMFLASMMVMFIAGIDTRYLGMLALVGVMALFILFGTASRAGTWTNRLLAYTGLPVDAEANYQATQANIAIASGGMFGKGVGKSSQRNFIPQAHADFVYAIVVEEYGLVGGTLVVALYLLLLFRSVSIVTLSKTFGALMAAGLSFLLVLQAMVNMAVTVGLLPVTGLTLPIVSMGGTSIIFTGVSLGIILSVSRDAIEKTGAKKPAKTSTGRRRRASMAARA